MKRGPSPFTILPDSDFGKPARTSTVYPTGQKRLDANEYTVQHGRIPRHTTLIVRAL